MKNLPPLLTGTALIATLALTAGLRLHGADAPAQPADALHQPTAKTADHGLFTPADLKWQPGPDALPPGSQMALLEGNPKDAGPFTARVKVPDGYTIPPHTHPGVEHVTVLSGTLLFGMGDKFDDKALQPLPAGSFAFMKPGMTHFVRTKGQTIVQLHGIGPWDIHYVNPADDPRTSKTAQETR